MNGQFLKYSKKKIVSAEKKKTDQIKLELFCSENKLFHSTRSIAKLFNSIFRSVESDTIFINTVRFVKQVLVMQLFIRKIQ